MNKKYLSTISVLLLIFIGQVLSSILSSSAAAYEITSGAANGGGIAGSSASYAAFGVARGNETNSGSSSNFALNLGVLNSIYFTSLTASSTPIILSVDPASGPAGTRITVTGDKFGATRGDSTLVFEDTVSGRTYTCEIISWSNTLIEAIMPGLASAGSYRVKVFRKANLSGVTYTLESNSVLQQITVSAAVGTATIYPNPFNAGSASVNLVLPSPGSTTNIGFYIYDTTAQLVYRQVVVSPSNSITWDGLDSAGALVGNGIFLLRIVDEDSRTLLAKGKILVIKQ